MNNYPIFIPLNQSIMKQITNITTNELDYIEEMNYEDMPDEYGDWEPVQSSNL